MNLSFQPIWSDSLGAKSFCTLVKTPNLNLLIDPGIAIMHDSFPGDETQKQSWLDKGKNEIEKAMNKADVIIISHYHHDHYFSDDLLRYRNKTLLMKNPNEYINDTQRNRAEKFIRELCQHYDVTESCQHIREVSNRSYQNPLEDLPLAKGQDYGDYQKRKNELFQKGMIWFNNRVDRWRNYHPLSEIKSEEISISFPEYQTYEYGSTILRFSGPLFHGIEFARVGWVFATIIECNETKLLYTSDLCGPMIEDYADFIIKENPDILILDGPMTYMYGYLLTTINLNRTINNAIKIIKNIDAECIIYDHHLLRETKYKQHTQAVWDTAEKEHVHLETVAEHLGKKPVLL